MDHLQSIDPATGSVVGQVPPTLAAHLQGMVDRARTAQADWDVARRLSAGMIGVNRAARGAVGTPWVGARESGFGFHESKDGHRQFTQTRVLTRPL